MPLKRKHRVVVELTTSKAIDAQDAVRAMLILIQRIDLGAKPIWANNSNIYADKLTAKNFDRVARAEAAKGSA